jgi:hypothetical protein
MMNLSAFYLYLIRLHPNLIRSISFLCVLFTFLVTKAHSQEVFEKPIVVSDTVPKPSSVWIKSAVLPGWGQAVNNQAWKIPVVYATLAGLSYYSISQNKEYNAYRAAFYNAVPGNTDQKFGQTRADLVDLPPELLRYNRNTFRNRRDLGILFVVAAWGLNVIDAYVFAQLRDFDTGPDLSIQPSIYPIYISQETTYTFDLKLSFPLKTK